MNISIEEKQKSLYAALIRYSSDANALRERVVDHLALIALQDTSEGQRITAGNVRKNIEKGLGSSELRIEVVQDSLLRIEDKGFCATGRVNNKPGYYITNAGQSELDKISNLSNEIVTPCIDRILDGYSFNEDHEDVTRICKRFIINSFAEYGHTMAQSITGEIKHSNISNLINANRVYEKAISGISLDIDKRHDLFIRCKRFLKSDHPSDIEVKFALTQVYYVAKVLELDSSDFDPLAESTFKGAVIYLDSNVLFDALFDVEEKNLFDDLSALSSNLDISLCVTELTIEEMTRVLRNRKEALERIVEKVPEKLYEDNTDNILRGFLRYLSENENADYKGFLEFYGDIRSILESKGISYVPLNVGTDYAEDELASYSEVVAQEALSRKTGLSKGKSDLVIEHDAALLLLVKNQRMGNGKSWFLTKDSTLNKVCKKLNGKRSLVFSLSAFLQCISPFVNGGSANTLYQLFDNVLENDGVVAGVSNIFELSELQIISEYYIDILATESDQLHMAFEFVKSSYLNGNEINSENQHLVHLKISQFLRSGVDEQTRLLTEEIERKEKNLREANSEIDRRSEVQDGLTRENSKLRSSLDAKISELNQDYWSKLIYLLPLLLFGGFISVVLWNLPIEILSAYDNKPFVKFISSVIGLSKFIKIFGSVVFFFSVYPFARWIGGQSEHVSHWIAVIAAAVSVHFSEVFSDSALSSFLNLIAIGGLIAGALSLKKYKRNN